MKLFISIIIFVSIIGKAQHCKAYLTIETDNELAFVIINDDEPVNGKTTTFELEAGKYFITIGEASDRWNAKTFYDTIVISGCEKVYRLYQFFNHSFLDTEPQDASVFIADTLLGHTPLLLSHDIDKITLRKKGFEEKSATVKDLKENQRILLKSIPVEENSNFFESSLFLYLSGSLLVFGGVTAYFKLQADDRYTEYQLTGDESLLRDTRRLDTISGITFAALQINFGFLIYYFLSD